MALSRVICSAVLWACLTRQTARKQSTGTSGVERGSGGQPRAHPSAIAAAAVMTSKSRAMKIETGIEKLNAQSNRQAVARKS